MDHDEIEIKTQTADYAMQMLTPNTQRSL